jgi:peptidoglycan hydrolase-like protein with peptidoglycan-binding domain
VAVHDRGGAIVNAGQRNQAYDRLDLWMGFGDAGLSRALALGRRTVQATVYGVDSSLQENVDLTKFAQAEIAAEAATGQAPRLFTQDLTLNYQNDEVKTLQTSLKQLGYYNGDITGTYDEATLDAVAKFQIAVGLVDTANDFGAGYFGSQTRRSLEDALNQKGTEIQNHLPQTPLSKDDQGVDVKKLQTALQKLGYDVTVTGVYDDQTVNAILKFQKDQKVVTSDSDFGAGVFGPKTMQVLAMSLAGVSFDDANAADTTSTDTVMLEESATVQPVIVFTRDLQLGDSGPDVTRLQQELKKMNYLGIDPTGNYGAVTQHAVMKFQEAQGLIASETDSAAGFFGFETRAKIHGIIGQRKYVDDLISQRTDAAKKDEEVALK